MNKLVEKLERVNLPISILVKNGFIQIVRQLQITTTGEIHEITFFVTSPQKRGKPAVQIPIYFCPISGVELKNIKIKFDIEDNPTFSKELKNE